MGPHAATSQVQRIAVREIEQACEGVQTPLHRMEDALHPWTSYLILPVFALANAGVSLEGTSAAARDPITLGIVLGLVVGKPLGILAFAWLAVRLGLATLPAEISWRHIAGAACLGGIGFTMSLFVAGLAFGKGPDLVAAKLGILSASAISALLGFLVLRTAGHAEPMRTPSKARG
jgi:NhaA family Na+:H+ antiporter